MDTHIDPAEFPFADEAGYRNAIDNVIASTSRELRIFNDTLERMRFEDKPRAELLAAYLATSPLRRLHIVLHNPRYAESNSPRLLALIRRFPNAIEIRESATEYKHVADCHLLADAVHGVRRFHSNHARGKLLLNMADDIRPWWQRFDELWRSGTPCLAPTQIGL